MNHLNLHFKKLCLTTTSSEKGEPIRRNTTPILRTRKHAELEKCWELDQASREDIFIATSDKQRHLKRKTNSDQTTCDSSKQKRKLKLDRKMLNRACLETDLHSF